jgi:hypothetical protein
VIAAPRRRRTWRRRGVVAPRAAVFGEVALPAITRLSGESLAVGVGEKEEYLVDGACGMPLAILAGAKRFRPNTLIVFESRPHPKHLPWFEQWLRLLTRRPIRPWTSDLVMLKKKGRRRSEDIHARSVKDGEAGETTVGGS